MDKVAVLIPCFNEELTVEKVVKDFKQELPEAVIYVYDNNSTDATAELAERAGAVVVHEYKQGKGNVVRRMFNDINAEVYVMVDGDDTYPANAVREMVNRVERHRVDMVVGDRLSSTYFSENKRRFHNFGNSLVRNCINKIFKSDIKDIMTGMRAFSYRFVKTLPVMSQGFEIETEMTMHALAMNMSIENVVVEYRDRPQGSESKLNTIRDGLRVIIKIFDLFKNYRPLLFFSIISILLALISLGIFIPIVLIPYLNTGLVEHYPTLFVCCFVLLVATMSFFGGLILDAIKNKERREFEFRLMIIETKK